MELLFDEKEIQDVNSTNKFINKGKRKKKKEDQRQKIVKKTD